MLSGYSLKGLCCEPAPLNEVGLYYNLSRLEDQSINSLNQISGNFTITVYQDIVSILYAAGALAFEIEIYELEEEDDDWFGTVFSVIVGIGQICLGIALLTPAGGAFATAMAYSLIGAGIGDIMSSAISLIQGVPIDLEGYLRSKAIGLAVSVIVSGITFLGVHFKLFALSEGISIKQIILEQLAFQAGMIGVSTLVQNAGKQILNSNDGDIERSIQEEMKRLLAECSEALKIIFASDETERTHLAHKLLTEASAISRGYAKRFNSDFAQGVKGVAPSAATTFVGMGIMGKAVGLGVAAGSAAINAGMGYIKVDEALPEFRERFGEVIQTLSAGVKTRTFSWMERQLENSYPSQGHAMMTLLTEYGFAGNLDIDYTHCGRIESFDLRYFEEKKQGIKSACDSIAHLMSDSHIAEKKQNLGESISHIVFGNIKNMVKSDIISPIANFVGGYVGGLASGLVSEHFNTQKQQLKEFRQYLEQLIPTPNMEITFNPKNYEPDTLFEPFKNIQENTYIEIDNPHESENQEPTEKIKIIFIPKSKTDAVKKQSKSADNQNVEDVYTTPLSVEERISQGFDNKKQAVLDNIHKGLKKINHQDDYMVIKWLNQFYVVEKGMVQGLMLMGEAEFATHYPNLYETIEDKFDKAGEYVGDKIHKLDKTLTRLGGKDYTDFKHNVGDFLTTVNKNAPEFVRDGLALIALGGPIVKGTGFVIDKVGDVFDKFKPIDISKHIDINFKFSTHDLTTYGTIVETLVQDMEIKSIAAKWGVGKNGGNQLLEHTLGKANDIKRFIGLETIVGLEQETLTKIFSNNIIEKTSGLKAFGDLADKIIATPTEKLILEGGKKEVYWFQSIYEHKKGISIIKYDDKIQTMMNMEKKDFNKRFKNKTP